MDDINRRRLLAGTAAAAIGAAVQSVAVGKAAAAPGDDWLVLETATKETVLDGHRVRLRAYNGQIPGPTITIVPGQVLRIRLKNNLPPYDSSAWNGDHNVPHGFDATNLHVHGLDVVPHIFEPIGTSDPLAPQIVVGPGETKDYIFEIPVDHPSGFNFYHPHKHGSTAVQLLSGLAGGLIVRGAIDEVPEIKAALADITDYLTTKGTTCPECDLADVRRLRHHKGGAHGPARRLLDRRLSAPLLPPERSAVLQRGPQPRPCEGARADWNADAGPALHHCSRRSRPLPDA